MKPSAGKNIYLIFHYTFMLNHFHTSIRHIRKNILYSIINVAGLATAITAILFAMMYWKDERSFDRFHANHPNLYRITTTLIENPGAARNTLGSTGQVQGPAFKAAIPGIKNYVRVLGGEISGTITSAEKNLNVQTVFADRNFFELFSFKMLKGNPHTALNDVGSAVITRSTAMKFFNTTDVLGKQLTMDADPSFEKLGKPMIVSAVVEDAPFHSSLKFDVVFTLDYLQLSFTDENWLNAYMGTFVELEPEADINEVKASMNRVFSEKAKDQLYESKASLGFDPQISYGLQPLTAIHLNPLIRTTGNIENGVVNGSNAVYSYMFAGIAFFIMLMAAINFINISIAGTLKRAKETGIRKISGGSSRSIITQFLLESAMLCFIAFVIAVAAVNILMPLFNVLSGKQIQPASIVNADLLLNIMIAFFLIVAMTGLYPAFVLARFKPSAVLYNKQRLSGKNVLGKSLVVVQYSLAICLLICTIVYYSQMDFVRTKDLGYNPNQIIRTAVGGDRDYKQVISLLKSEFSKEPSIKSVSFGNDGYPEDVEHERKRVKTVLRNIDENFLSTLEIPLITGRNISPADPADLRNGALVNEAFVKAFNIHQPVGKLATVYRYDDTVQRVIRGVVKDFHFNSLREPIQPMLMYVRETADGGIWIKFNKTQQQKALQAVQTIYQKAMPSAVFDYRYLDELNAAQYFQEQRWQKIIFISAILSFVVCILGLFGLAHLSTNRRVKEIGIRKVLGASVQQIVSLLSADFLKLVGIAFLIASPFAWVVMHQWLQDFAYHIKIGPLIFMGAAAIAVFAALMAIGYQSVKAALSNPVDSLRNE
jgi:putative ABC transport system permease protein